MSRQDQYNVTVSIDGKDQGTWDKMSGGEIDSEELKYKPGAMAPQVSLGGSVSVSNITVSRLYDLARDHSGTAGSSGAAFLKSRVGKAEVTVTKQPLDINGATFGAPIVYTGKLKQVKFPDADSEGNNAAMVELEISSAGAVG